MHSTDLCTKHSVCSIKEERSPSYFDMLVDRTPSHHIFKTCIILPIEFVLDIRNKRVFGALLDLQGLVLRLVEPADVSSWGRVSSPAQRYDTVSGVGNKRESMILFFF